MNYMIGIRECIVYDAAGNVIAATDAEGRRVELVYDLNGNRTEIVYPDGTKDITEYDLLGRIVRQIPRTGLITEYEYDALGNVLSVTRGEQATRYEYDLLGHRVKTIRADGTKETYSYDALGNLLGVTDPMGSTTAFAYTAESLLEKVTYINRDTGLLSYVNLEGEYIGGWKYSKDQLLFHITNGIRLK